MNLENFKTIIWDFYKENGRSFAWRHIDDPYKVLVSEIMLQQTQTQRVAEKYQIFIQRFPTIESLAQASLHDVLFYWQGLGYNRRGKYLYETAKKISQEYHNRVPDCPEILLNFPGIGPYTASSICAFAYNKPTIFIETNIRAVFIHFFFKDFNKVHDKEILPLVAQTVDSQKARDWYYALMDYGVMLKKSVINPSRKSKHHAKQSTFEGSDRQIRGKVLKALTENKELHFEQLLDASNHDMPRLSNILQQLINERLIANRGSIFFIAR